MDKLKSQEESKFVRIVLMLKNFYDPDEKYLGEMSGFIIKKYGNIIRERLHQFPCFPTWKQAEKIMDVIEGVYFEKELECQHRKILSDNTEQSPIKEQLSLIDD